MTESSINMAVQCACGAWSLCSILSRGVPASTCSVVLLLKHILPVKLPHAYCWQTSRALLDELLDIL